MNDLISRQAAIEAVHKSIFDFFDICDDDEESPMTYKDELLLELNKAITTQIKAVVPTPVKHGRWLFTDVKHVITSLLEGDVPQTLTCSFCGFKHKFVDEYGYSCIWHYCPNCGARMDDPMTEMSFPQTIEEFMEQYKVIDTEQVYSNGVEFVPIFRIKQWLEHQREAQKENEPPLFKATQEAKRRIVNAFMGRKDEVEE